LKDRLAEFARFPEMNPGPVLRVDLEGNVIMSNSAAQNIFSSKLNGCRWQDICPGIDEKTWSGILTSKKPVAVERKIDDKDFVFHHRRDFESDLVFIYGTDISEQKQAQQALREADEFVRLLLNSTGEGIYGMDVKGKCTFANPACAKLLGFKDVEELLGKQMHNLIHRVRANGEACPVEESRIFKALKKEEGTHVDDEVMFRADNSSFPVEYWSYPLKKDGELIGCMVTFMNISDRRQTEQLQSDYTKALAEIARFPEMNPGPVLRIDMEGKVLMANEAAHRIFDTKPIGLFWRDICPDIDDTTWNKIKETKTVVLERHARDRDYIFTHRQDIDGNLVFVFGADVTEQKQAERALQQTEKMAALGKLSAGLAHELNNPAAAAARAGAQLLETLDNMQAAIIDLRNSKIDPALWGELIKRVAEFRERATQPLTLSPLEISDQEEELQSWLELNDIEYAWEIASTMVTARIMSKDLEAIASLLPLESLKPALEWICRIMTAYELAGNVVRSTRNISNLVDVVKSYSHMDKAPQKYVDIHTGIEDTLTILAHKLKQGIKVIRQYGQDLPQIKVQGSEFNQVWMNLIDNAVAAMGEQGNLTIRTFQEGNHLVVEIADDGPGIPKEIQARIFEPFFTTKDVGEGAGLGLDVVHRIVTHQCMGQINLRSKPGETVFKVCLPVKRDRR
jgi:PAS domain S-box-containing protein